MKLDIRAMYEGNYNLAIYDITGKLMFKKDGYIDNIIHFIQQDVSDWTKGVYLVSIIIDNEVISKKFIKE